MYTAPVSQLQDLIEKPSEREWIELKSWVDLTDHLARASTARHLAALSNYGGGYLVFGFNDDGTRCDAIADVRARYGRDVLAGIVDLYLVPKFQCDVHFEVFGGVEHPIVWVPSHGTTPVISKKDGPQNAKGTVQGIHSGRVYIRTPKPESVAITLPEQWDKLIQRCVLARRDELVGMFSAIVSSGTMPTPKDEDRNARELLDTWHRTTQQAFLTAAAGGGLALRFPIAENFVQFSYIIRTRDGSTISPRDALQILEKVNAAVRNTVYYGWSMFHVFTRPEIAACFATDAGVDGGATEFVETSLIEKGQSDHVDFWRVSMDGRASLIRNFHEDRRAPPEGIDKNGKWFDPWLWVRDITEVVRHAHALSEQFSGVDGICFSSSGKGFAGECWPREIHIGMLKRIHPRRTSGPSYNASRRLKSSATCPAS